MIGEVDVSDGQAVTWRTENPNEDVIGAAMRDERNLMAAAFNDEPEVIALVEIIVTTFEPELFEGVEAKGSTMKIWNFTATGYIHREHDTFLAHQIED